MKGHRGSHYWLWFLLFGVLPLLNLLLHGGHLGLDAQSKEVYWLVGAGLLGLVFGLNSVNEGKLAKPFDVIIGIIFALAGLVGILNTFGIGFSPVVGFFGTIGLMTSFLYALIHTFLGIKSLHHGLEKK
jgi:hypothetical protein